MGKVIFLMNVSVDGYIETPDHSLDWTITDDELLTPGSTNDCARPR